MEYHKLVRDRIPEYIQSKGEEVEYHIADEEEYHEKLMEKLSEEVREFQEDPSIEELADLFEVIDAVAEHRGFDPEDLKRVREEKATEKGRFANRIILDES